MTQEKPQYLWYLLGAVVLIVLFVVGRGKGPGSDQYAVPTPSVSPSAVVPTPTPKAVKATPSKSAPAPLSYENAMKEYDGKRLQFDAYCQANPKSLALSNGARVMIDNRSGDARTFAVNGVFFTLPGYGWKIVTVSAKTVPAVQYIDCGSARNVGTLLVQ